MNVKSIKKALNWRYAVKQFSTEKVDDGIVKGLLEATQLSASSFGLQPYRLLIVKSASVREELLPFSLGQDKVLNSSHLIVFAAQTDIGDETVDRYIARMSKVRGVPVEEMLVFDEHLKQFLAEKSDLERQEWAHQQAYIALGNFLTCAAIMQIDTCPMTGIQAEGYDRILGLSEQGLTTTAICVLGKRHPGDQSADLKKVRYAYDEMVRTI